MLKSYPARSVEAMARSDEAIARSDEATVRSDEATTRSNEATTRSNEATTRSDKATSRSDEATVRSDDDEKLKRTSRRKLKRNSLTVTTASALLDVLMAADKFEVASCIRYCSRHLHNMPMTPDSALLYLELSSSVLMAEAVEPLTDAAKQFLASSFVKIDEIGELFEEARETLNKNVVCEIQEIPIYKAL
ncbi:hypothetical protein Rs2_21287 [Raphanus sativus]|nr:hypothetical protein Rs2_21287 [Raphanus sativus]